MQVLLSGEKKRRYVVLTIAAIVPVLLVMLVMFGLALVIDHKLNQSVEQQVITFTQQVADSIAGRIVAAENTIKIFSVQSSDPQKVLPALDALKKQTGFSSVAFARMDGTGIESGGAPFSTSRLSYAETALSQGAFSYSGTFISGDGEYACAAQKPLYIDGVQIGALYVQIPLKLFVAPEHLDIAEGRGCSILFEAQSGKVLVSSKRTSALPAKGNTLYAFLEKAAFQDLVQVPAPAPAPAPAPFGPFSPSPSASSFPSDLSHLRGIIGGGKGALAVASVSGVQSYIGIAPVAYGNWYVCSIIPMKNAQAETGVVIAMFHAVLGIVLACLLGLGITSLVTYRRRVRDQYVTMLAQLYQALSDSVDLAVNLYSPENNSVIPFVAKEASVIGYTLDEFLNNMQLADEAGLSQEGRDLFRRLKGGLIGEFEQGEFSLQPQGGLERWVSYSVRPLIFENKPQVLVVLRDSTADKRIQLSMKEAMCAAETANQAKSDFLSRMSHEIRTPLNVIIGMLQIARKDAGNEEKTKENLAKIGIASDHLLGLINDVLDLSKIENGKMTLSIEAFRLSDMLKDVVCVIRPYCEQRQQKLIVRSDSQADGVYMGDEVRLKQLLLNLLSNASKYTPEHGCITLETKVSFGPVFDSRQITFIVSDNGIGMSEDYLKHLFEPFTMEGRAREQGTGLGMSIVKSIVTMMGGAIEVDSALHKGSTFTVVLNLRRAFESERKAFEESSAQQRDTAIRGHAATVKDTSPHAYFIGSSEMGCATIDDLKGVRILIAEDNDLNAEIVCELLSGEGLETERARDGEEACEMFKNSAPGHYDAILMDVQMPKMNGHDATRCIRTLKRADARSVPIIAMSANAFSEDVCASLASGMDAHLSKPIDINRTLAVIAKYVHEYRAVPRAEEAGVTDGHSKGANLEE